MHPAVRITCLLILAAFLPLLPVTAGLAVTAALILVHLLFLREQLPRFLQSVLRLKWLYLAILILYVGFTPGTSVFPGLAQPSWEGLSEGLFRCAVLVAILAAVHIYTAATETVETCDGILWLTTPFRPLGLDRERLAVRLSLTLDYVAGAEQSLRSALERRKDDGLIPVAANVISALESDSPGPPVEGTVRGPGDGPRLQHWLWPLGLFLVLMLLTRLS